MSKFCPITNSKVVYLVCQECEDRVCEKHHVAILPKKEKREINQPQHNESVSADPVCSGTCASCSTCCNKLGNELTTIFGKEMQITKCKVYHNYLIDENKVSHNGCEYHNKDMSNEKLCMNCDYYLGGGDWGLACSRHYHKLPTALSPACDDFQKRSK